ncbi:MAG: hypothetical protein CL912_04735 [Deltaproteobacteria bacterium]|nr:hypothetical protein [Deltaproteobacteria bacterium]
MGDEQGKEIYSESLKVPDIARLVYRVTLRGMFAGRKVKVWGAVRGESPEENARAEDRTSDSDSH